MKKNTINQIKQVLIVNGWHDSNKGDSAINLGLIEALYRHYGQDLKIGISSYIPNTSKYYDTAFRHVRELYPQVKTIDSSLPAYLRELSLKKVLFNFIRGSLKLLLPRLIRDKGEESFIKGSDIIISTGGLYFAFPHKSFYRIPFRMLAFSYPLLLAKVLNKRFVFYAQSFGPFNNKLSRKYITWLMNHSYKVLVRESISTQLLKDMGVEENKVVTVPDAAFGMKIDKNIKDILNDYQLNENNYAVLSARSLTSYGHDNQLSSKYVDNLLKAIEYLTEKYNKKVAIVSHTTGPTPHEDDRVISKEIYSKLPDSVRKQTVLIDEDLTPPQLAGLYGSASCLIATRFHAVVLSILAGTPVFAIPYFGSKTEGTLKDLGIEEFILQLNDLTSIKIEQRLENLFENMNYYKEKFEAIGFEVNKDAYETLYELDKREFNTRRLNSEDRII
jgi:colanic acid/amylovoran biosynthesis protein